MLEKARGVRRLIGLGIGTAGWVGYATLRQQLVPEGERYALFQHYMKGWARSLVRACGGHVELTPESLIPAHRGPRLVVANHRSPFDIGVLLGLFGGHALSRADLEGWPVLGMAAKRAGTIFVDREDAQSGASAIRTIRKRLRDGASILVFPEGHTFEGDEVQPFKAGAFTALRGLDVEIVPVGLAYDPGAEYLNESFVHHVVRVAQRPITRCVVHVGTPRLAKERANVLASSLQGEVQQLVNRAREYWRHTARA